MIPLSTPKGADYFWQQQLAQSISNPVELIQLLGLPDNYVSMAELAASAFPLRVTHDYLSCIRGDINDPLLRQVLPVMDENVEKKGFVESRW